MKATATKAPNGTVKITLDAETAERIWAILWTEAQNDEHSQTTREAAKTTANALQQDQAWHV